MKPAIGPAAPMSRSWRRSFTIVRSRMKAPKVPMPKGGGKLGKKNGGDTLIW